RFRTEWLALAAILLLVGAVLALSLYRSRLALEAQEGERLQGQARVIDDNLVRQLQGANNALTGIRDEFERGPLDGARAVAASGRLKLLSNAMPGVRVM